MRHTFSWDIGLIMRHEGEHCRKNCVSGWVHVPQFILLGLVLFRGGFQNEVLEFPVSKNVVRPCDGLSNRGLHHLFNVDKLDRFEAK